MDLQGQRALVTGASRGIGKAVALMLGGRGATVVGSATSAAGAQSITDYLRAAGAQGRGVQLDVRVEANVESVVAEFEKEYGAVSILVNNAGITQDNLAMRMKEAEWDAVIDTNLKSVFRLSKAVLRGMLKARAGRIINITSVVGSSGNAGQINYAAAKAGIGGMTRSLAREIGSRGVTVNCVAPGFIDTDMTRALSDEQRAALLLQIPLGRLGNPEDVAAVVAFLASPQAAYITGATLHVNGGMYMG
ncbi:MAG TPA: 3-oxoacyl-ACP reductase FabG [Burkholderiales bacterium]|nr:3-oxoacyl-ACP reductase FabG [Burkholderiales bacterium]